MVLEEIIKTADIWERPIYGFFLGVFFSIIGILTARLIFGSNPDMMAIAFTTLLTVPQLNKLIKREEMGSFTHINFSLKNLFTDHKDIFYIYTYLFFGMLLTFMFTAVWSNISDLPRLFTAQLEVAGIAGEAVHIQAFQTLLYNNMKVLIVCFILSLLYGVGSVLFLTWNASVWGVVFGYAIKMASLTKGQSIFVTLFIVLGPVVPHLIAEAMAYLSAAIVGGVVSKALVKEELFSDKFKIIARDGLFLFAFGIIMVVLGALLESRLM